MFTSGKAPKLDVLRAEVQLANVQQELSKDQNALQVASAQLNDIVGRKIDAQIAIDIQIEFEKSVASPKADLQSYINAAFESNPQWRRIKESIAATEAKIKAEKSAYWPDISFKADYGYEWGDWPPEENIWNLGMAISIPLWDGGITGARVNQAKATLERLEATEKLLAKQIALQVQKAYLSLREAEGRISTTEKSVEQAKESLRIAEGSYNLGTGISSDVIDVQVALTQSQTNYIQALIDVQLAKADLERAIGKNDEVKQ
jgi:outer membrane protein TolC